MLLERSSNWGSLRLPGCRGGAGVSSGQMPLADLVGRWIRFIRVTTIGAEICHWWDTFPAMVTEEGDVR